MKPIFVILYAVVVTLLLVLAFPRLGKANPRLLWSAAIAGALGLLALVVLALAR